MEEGLGLFSSLSSAGNVSKGGPVSQGEVLGDMQTTRGSVAAGGNRPGDKDPVGAQAHVCSVTIC